MAVSDLVEYLPATDQRLVAVGPSGCGKSTWMRQALAHYDDVVVVDSKREFTWHDHDTTDVCLACTYPWRFRHHCETIAELERLFNEVHDDESGDPIVISPSWTVVSSGKIDRVPEICMERGSTLLAYDDFIGICTASDYQYRAPQFERSVCQGRSAHVAVWALLQSPLWAPKILLRLSNARVVFNLRSTTERKAMEEICGPLPWAELEAVDHRFIYDTDRITIGPKRLITIGEPSDALAI